MANPKPVAVIKADHQCPTCGDNLAYFQAEGLVRKEDEYRLGDAVAFKEEPSETFNVQGYCARCNDFFYGRGHVKNRQLVKITANRYDMQTRRDIETVIAELTKL